EFQTTEVAHECERIGAKTFIRRAMKTSTLRAAGIFCLMLAMPCTSAIAAPDESYPKLEDVVPAKSAAVQGPTVQFLFDAHNPEVQTLYSAQFPVRENARRTIIATIGEFLQWHDTGPGNGPKLIGLYDEIIAWLGRADDGATTLEFQRRVRGIK